jgi:deoxycytidylate deaminase
MEAWHEMAYKRFCDYAKSHSLFITEDVRIAAELAGLRSPTSRRAWGAVAVRAKHDGVVVNAGYAVAHGNQPNSNPTPVTRWRAA